MAMEERKYKIHYRNTDLEISAHYREGPGGLIFFIHGLGCTRESFSDLRGFPELRKYSILVPDLAGFGDSARPAGFSYTMEDHAGVCALLLENFPGGDIHIAGHSMGGAIGLILAEGLGTRLKTFINIEGNLFRTDCSVSRSAATVMDFNRFKETLFTHIRIFTPVRKEKGTALWGEWIEKSDPDGFNKSAQSLVKWTDSGGLLKKFLDLGCRKVYVCGERNSKRKILERLEGIPIISIAGSGHFPMNDNPDEFYRFMIDFLNQGERIL